MGYAKITVTYEVLADSLQRDSFHFTISDAIPVTDESGNEVLLEQFYSHFKHILEENVKGVDSSKGLVKSIIIRVFTTEMPKSTPRRIEEQQRFLTQRGFL